eukprot:9094589-Pyramimonas_sp.AAC.1
MSAVLWGPGAYRTRVQGPSPAHRLAPRRCHACHVMRVLRVCVVLRARPVDVYVLHVWVWCACHMTA